MNDYLRLFVYKIVRRLALWTGRFYTVDEHRRLLTKEAERWRTIVLSEKETDWFRSCHQALVAHKKDMAQAIMFGINSDCLKQLKDEK